MGGPWGGHGGGHGGMGWGEGEGAMGEGVGGVNFQASSVMHVCCCGVCVHVSAEAGPLLGGAGYSMDIEAVGSAGGGWGIPAVPVGGVTRLLCSVVSQLCVREW